MGRPHGHLGEQVAAERVETALRAVIAEGRRTTYDLGGDSGTSEFAAAIVERLERQDDAVAAPVGSGSPNLSEA